MRLPVAIIPIACGLWQLSPELVDEIAAVWSGRTMSEQYHLKAEFPRHRACQGMGPVLIAILPPVVAADAGLAGRA